MTICKSFISGVAGTTLNREEKAFITEQQPWGFILFARNIDHGDATQLGRLTDALRQISERDNVPIFIDQEGGRVQRLRPPLVAAYPPARLLGQLYQKNAAQGLRAAFLMSRLHAFDLRRFGLNASCLPVLDVPVLDAHDVIGDRAYGHDAAMVTAMGEAAANGLLAGGVLPVMKHIPGHGRARCDTHLTLAHVEASLDILQENDFYPFRQLRHLPAAMSAHIVYQAIDAEKPATLSEHVIGKIIRTSIGFDGLLMSDDLSMQALQGRLGERARASFAAGCDMVLHCNGNLDEMREVAGQAPVLSDKSYVRAQAALACIRSNDELDGESEVDLRAEFFDLITQG